MDEKGGSCPEKAVGGCVIRSLPHFIRDRLSAVPRGDIVGVGSPEDRISLVLLLSDGQK